MSNIKQCNQFPFGKTVLVCCSEPYFHLRLSTETFPSEFLQSFDYNYGRHCLEQTIYTARARDSRIRLCNWELIRRSSRVTFTQFSPITSALIAIVYGLVTYFKSSQFLDMFIEYWLRNIPNESRCMCFFISLFALGTFVYLLSAVVCSKPLLLHIKFSMFVICGQ